MRFASWCCALLCLVACGRRESGPTEGSFAICSDQADNDGDGLIDCADADCRIYSHCMSGLNDGGSDSATGAGDLCVDTLDVVFVLDVSTSMADDLDRIRQGLGDIWTAATNLSPSAQFSMVVFVDDVLAVNHCAPFTTRAALESAFDDWRDFCSTGENPVSRHSANDCPENTLDALYTAATMCPWRTPSTRVIVHVTDDTFAEAPTQLSTIPVRHSYQETIEALTSNEIRVGSFATPSGLATWWCSGNTTGEGFFEAWDGQASISMATGGRAWSIVETRAGTLDMDRAITDLVTEEFCTVY